MGFSEEPVIGSMGTPEGMVPGDPGVSVVRAVLGLVKDTFERPIVPLPGLVMGVSGRLGSVVGTFGTPDAPLPGIRFLMG